MTKQKTIPKRMICVILSVCMIVTSMVGFTFTVSAGGLTNNFPTAPGDWELTNNITITETKTLTSGNWNIDLNGNTITLSGSAKIVVQSGAALVLSNGTIKGNSTTTNKGAMLNVGGTGLLTLNNVSLRDHTGGTQGAAVHIESGSASIYDSLIENNRSQRGAVYVSDGKLTMQDVYMTDNRATTPVESVYANGGALHILGSSTVECNYCTFSSNAAREYGGGLFLDGTSANVRLNYCTFENNIATQGGGIYAGSGSLTLTDNTITANSVSNGNQNNGAGIMVSDNMSTFRLQSSTDSSSTFKTYIADNKTANNKQSNLATKKLIQITNKLKIESSIGIVNLVGHTSDADYSGQFTNDTSYSNLLFNSDISGYKTIYSSSRYRLAKERTLTVNGGVIMYAPDKTTGIYGVNENLIVTADTPSAGMKFDQWIAVGVTLNELQTVSSQLHFTMPDNDVLLTAVFVVDPDKKFNITVNGGTADKTKAVLGETVTISADEDTDYLKFSDWSSKTGNVTFNNKTARHTTFKMPAEDVEIDANYVQYFDVKITDGKAVPAIAKAGETVTVTADPAPEGKVFDKWIGSYGPGKMMFSIEFDDETKETTSFTMPPTANHYVSATYKDDPDPSYSITVINGTADTLKAKKGTKVIITAKEAPEGKVFDTWSWYEGDGFQPVSFENIKSSVTSFTMPAGKVQIEAKYKDDENSFKILVIDGTADKAYAKPGEKVYLTAGTPPTGKEFDRWTCDNADVSFNDPKSEITFMTMIGADIVVTANFKDIEGVKHPVYVSHGTPSDTTALAGEIITITADEPPTGKVFDKWTSEQGIAFANENASVTTFVMPDKTVNITATYRIPETTFYSIKVLKGTASTYSASEGTTVTITADLPETGKMFERWTCDNMYVVFDDAYSETTTFKMVGSDITISANYIDIVVHDKYTVNVTGGAAVPAEAKPGEKVTLMAAYPAVGKVFDKWTSATIGVVFDDANSAETTFIMPAKDVYVTANYKDAGETYYKVSVTNGTASPSNAKAGTEVTIKADAPVVNNVFDKWYSPNTNVIFKDRYSSETTFIMPANDVEMIATYKAKEDPDPDYVITKDFASIKDAVKEINNQIKKKTNKTSYVLGIPDTYIEKTVTLPKGNITVTLTGGTLRTNSLTANCNTIINCTLAPESKAVNLKAAKDMTLTIKKPGTFGAISGTKTSDLIIEADITADSVKTFEIVNTDNNILTINKAMSAAPVFYASLKYKAGIAKNINIPRITGGLSITIDGEIKSGTSIFTYSGKDTFNGELVTVTNTDNGKLLEAFIYNKKDVRAEIPDLLLLNGEFCPSWEKAVELMNEAKDYVVTLTGNITVNKATMPSKAKSLTIDGVYGYVVDFGKTKSITSKCTLILKDTELLSDSDFTAVKTGKFNLTLINSFTGSVSTGGRLTVNGYVLVNGDVSAAEINSTDIDNKLNYRSLAVTKYGIPKTSGVIMLRVIDKSGNAVKMKVGDKNAVVAKTFKGDFTPGLLVLDPDCGSGTLRVEKNKLILG